MATLKRYVQGKGYYVTAGFADHNKTVRVTYQVHPRAEDILARSGVRSGDSIPSDLFFRLLRDHLLYTHGGGPGESEETERRAVHTQAEHSERLQIPQKLEELLDANGNLISFGAFKVRFGGPGGYDDEVLRRNRAALEQELLRQPPREPAKSPADAPSKTDLGSSFQRNWLGEKFEKAFHYAALIHAGQFRKDTGIPYIAHLLGVTSIALEYGGSQDEAIAALLHDAGEDAGGQGRIDDIHRRFGQRVAKIVQGCTDAVTIPKPPWRERKVEYIAHVASADAATILVSASDKLHNARAILRDLRVQGDRVFDRFNGKKEGTLWYYRSLVTVFRAKGNSELISELDRVVAEIERLAAA